MQHVHDAAGALYVQMLRDAEAKSQRTVAAARTRKLARLKEARVEAQIELDEFRQVKEEAFLRKCDSFAVADSLHLKSIEQAAVKEQLATANRVRVCTPIVVATLESLVTTIDPRLHHNIVIRRCLETATQKMCIAEDDPHWCDEETYKKLEDCVEACEKAVINAKKSSTDVNNNSNDNSSRV